MIHVVAVITAKPGKREEILKHFRANMPAVHAEKGCIEYGPAIDADPALSFQAKYGPDTVSNVGLRCRLCRMRHNRHYAEYGFMPYGVTGSRGNAGSLTDRVARMRHNLPGIR